MYNVHMLERILIEAGACLREGFVQSGMDYSRKGAVDLVTEYDLKTEALICRLIEEAFPGDTIVAEERGGLAASGRMWIIDPIDGTTNFVHKHPFCCVSVALMIDGVLQLGGVYAPMLEKMYLAEKGGGAELNGRGIRVSGVALLQDALLATGFAYERASQKREIVDLLQRALNSVQGIRRCGSAALDMCFVAEGIIDVYIERGIQAWDIAAGALIVQEAGGRLSSFSGETLDIFGREVVATNTLIHQEALRALVQEA